MRNSDSQRIHFPGYERKNAVLILFFLTIILLTGFDGYAQCPEGNIPPPSVEELWSTREYFEYSVRYGPFHLGTITVEVRPDTLYNGKYYRYAEATIKGNPKLPFVSKKEQVFSSLMAHNDTIPYDILYWKDDLEKDEKKNEIYRLDYQKGKVFVTIKGQPEDTLALDEPSVCGPAYFFYTRIFAGTNKHLKVPLYVNQEKNYITMDNTMTIENINCSIYPGGHILTYTSSGNANFDGPFGFKGYYRAWYAIGHMKIPVQAYLRVWLGNVKIRLVKYTVIPAS